MRGLMKRPQFSRINHIGEPSEIPGKGNIMEAGITKAFESFMGSDNLEEVILSSTRASWEGSGYSVELFPSGEYRILWDNMIGNLHYSPGIILAIPALGEDEYSQQHEDGEHDSGAILEPFFDNAIEELQDNWERICEAEELWGEDVRVSS